MAWYEIVGLAVVGLTTVASGVAYVNRLVTAVRKDTVDKIIALHEGIAKLIGDLPEKLSQYQTEKTCVALRESCRQRFDNLPGIFAASPQFKQLIRHEVRNAVQTLVQPDGGEKKSNGGSTLAH